MSIPPPSLTNPILQVLRWRPGMFPSATVSLTSLIVGKDPNNSTNNRRKNVLLSSTISISSIKSADHSASDDVLPINLVRSWPEYSEIERGEVLVTIEHCCKCWQHRDVTRHNEQKYIEVR